MQRARTKYVADFIEVPFRLAQRNLSHQFLRHKSTLMVSSQFYYTVKFLLNQSDWIVYQADCEDIGHICIEQNRGDTLKLGQFILTSVARLMKVPPLAVEMFTAANQASGLDTKTLPTELIPLNSIQLSRGLLNFTILQAARDWILPFWAEQQYNPRSPSFIPRSHLGLSINVTNRNWTAVGNPDCAVEPIVDPRGLVTPFRNGWSIDVWLVVDGQAFFPSRSDSVDQKLVDNLPIVQTRFTSSSVQLILTSYTEKDILFHHVEIRNESDTQKQCTVAFAIRPLNPEGISLVHDLEFKEQQRCVRINNEAYLFFSRPADFIECSTFENGDCSPRLTHLIAGKNTYSAHCTKGMANGFAGYNLKLDPRASESLDCNIALTQGRNHTTPPATIEAVTSKWNDLLARGASIITPDPHINAILKSSLSSVLMLTDDFEITPGPLTYHQFWFRDAAYMLSALDKFGFASFTNPTVKTFPGKQERSGFFRSQQGEWDSNGQALWTVWQHALHSHDKTILDNSFLSLYKGVQWIEKKRLNDPRFKESPFAGLLPAGLSAEHLGLVDYYFWDNAWSIAGIEAFINICVQLGRENERQFAEQLLKSYRSDLERAIQRVQQQYQIKEIPASSTRGIDCGMIGSTCFWYPLQILPPNDPRMIATLSTLLSRYSVQGMFFQDFVHSGMNPYLTMHIAQAALYGGNREMFWDLLMTVLSRATATLTFPEAIHPATGGGSMGDGHHGWAAAEVLHSLRDAFIQERWTTHASHDLVLCAGLPATWFNGNKSFSIQKAVVPDGTISLHMECEKDETMMVIDLDRTGFCHSKAWILQLPFLAKRVFVDEAEHSTYNNIDGETHISLPARSTTIRIIHDC